MLRTAVPVAIVAAALLTAQSIPESPAPVNLNVTAVDSQGLPVADLRAEDFQVLDNGKPRKVVWSRPLPRTRPATFILLDLLNADFAARGLSANEINHALERLESADNVYLYLLTSGEKIFAIHSVVPPNGSDREKLDDGPWTRRIKPMLDDALRQVNGLKSEDDRYSYLRIAPTWKALASLVSQIAEVPGPKSFVWITQGVENGFFEPGRYFHLDTTPLRDFAFNLTVLQTAAFSVQQRPNGSLPPQSEGSPADTLEQLSALTGGRVYASDNTAQAIAQATGGAPRINYRIAFLPDRLDGKYHKLRVTSSRKDIKIQTAERYYAIADRDPAQRQQAMEIAIGRSPFDYPAIAVKATPAQSGFSIHLNAQDIELLKEGTRYRASLAIAFVESGVLIEGKPVDLDMSEQEYAKAQTDGIEIMEQVKLDASTGRVRVIVLDRNSNLAGTTTIQY